VHDPDQRSSRRDGADGVPGAGAAAARRRTVLTGPPDQAALHGVLTEVEALGLDLLEVRQLTPDCKSHGLGDTRSP
jgi:hypothetical protein